MTYTTSTTGLSFTTAANHLSTAVSELPEFALRQRLVSAVGKATIYKSDGSINTGNIDGWWKLSYSDRSKVWAERKRLGIKSPTKSADDSKNKENLGKGSMSMKNMQNRLKQLENSNADYKRKIKAMKKTVQFEEEAEEDTPDHAADEFGGRNSKKSKKS